MMMLMKRCGTVLRIDPNEFDAFKCKAIALIRMGQYDDCISFVDRKPEFSAKLSLERAYCLYRLQRFEDAQKIKQSPNSDSEHLVHQIQFRLQEYDDVIAFYEKEIDRVGDDEQRRDETRTNRIAAQILSGKSKDALLGFSATTSGLSYEVLFNASCAHVALSQFDEAQTILQRASDLCVKQLTADGYTSDEIDDELASIRLQMAFVHHMHGNLDKARELYQTVVDSKPSDKTCTAVALNNLASLKPDQGRESLFDSSRKITTGMHGDVMQRMSPEQRRALQMNHCLLLMHMKKRDACLKEVEKLKQQYPQSDIPIIIHASLLYREHKYQDAKNLLITFIEHGVESGVDVVRSLLTLCQMELSKLGTVESTLSLLSQFGSRASGDLLSRPGIVGAIVSLHLKENDIAGALRALDNAIERCSSNDSDRLSRLLLAKGVILTRITDDYAGSVDTYKQLLNLTKSESVQYYEVLALLVDALSHVDMEQARQYANKLPTIDIADMDLEQLEQGVMAGDEGERLLAIKMRQMHLSKDVQSMMVDEYDDEGEGGATTPEGVQRQKKMQVKKKKKIRLPKNYDPKKKPDPERWLPKSERSTTKKGDTAAMGSMKQMSRHQGASATPEVQPQPPPTTATRTGKKGKKPKGKKGRR